MTGVVVPIPRPGTVSATRQCSYCRATIAPAKSKNTRYCKDACRAAAAHARRASRAAPASPTQFSPASQVRPHSRYGVIASLLLLAGLLLGGGLAFAYHELLADDPLVTATEAQLALRRRPAGEYEKQSQARFWLPLCDSGDPMCTSYIAGLVDMQNGLRSPFFCPGTLRLAEVEAIVVRRLRQARTKRLGSFDRLVGERAPRDSSGLAEECGNQTPTVAVERRGNGGSTPMWKSVLTEAREVVWLASVVGGVSVVSVGIAIAFAAG